MKYFAQIFCSFAIFLTSSCGLEPSGEENKASSKAALADEANQASDDLEPS